MKRYFSCLAIVTFLYVGLSAQENRPLINPTTTPKPSSLLHLQNEVFRTYCALAGCHDGSFEPDFRTATSTYNTTVYHPVIKNNKQNSFAFRVVPHNPEQSVLYERIKNCCFVNSNDRMPFTIGDTLSDVQIKLVEDWIKSGALSIDGSIAEPPRYTPELSQMIKVGDRPGNAKYNDTQYRSDHQSNRTIRLPANTDSIWVSFEYIDKTSKATGFVFVYEENNYDSRYLSYSCMKRGNEMTGVVLLNQLSYNKPYFLRATIVTENFEKIFFPVDSANNYERLRYSILRQK